jgi:hypothetical protein
MNPSFPWAMCHGSHKNNGLCKSVPFTILILFWIFFDKLVRRFLILQGRKAEDLTEDDFLGNILFGDRPHISGGRYRVKSDTAAKASYNEVSIYLIISTQNGL